MSLVVPAVLPSSRADLEEKLGLFLQIPGVTRVQIDAVDGQFATPASWPYTDAGALHAAVSDMILLPRQDQISYEIDLMCLDSEQAAGDWVLQGVSRLTFHAASIRNLEKFLADMVEKYGRDVVTFGLALNLSTDPASIEDALQYVSYIQFMGIETIGRQGQVFDPRVVERVRLFHARHPDIPIQVDGGVSLVTVRALVEAGVTNLIVGSALIRAQDMQEEFKKFEALESPLSV